MIEPGFVYIKRAIGELTTFSYSGLLWKVPETTRLPLAAIASATIRIYPEHLEDDPAAEITESSPGTKGPENILNTGRGTIVSADESIDGQVVSVTRLTVAFLESDSRIVDAASMVTLVGQRRRVRGERHVALVEVSYSANRKLRWPIVWTVRNLAKVS